MGLYCQLQWWVDIVSNSVACILSGTMLDLYSQETTIYSIVRNSGGSLMLGTVVGLPCPE